MSEKKRGFSEGLDVKRKEMPAFAPSQIEVDWTRNTSRCCLYTFRGEPCCFRPEDVADLISPDQPTSLLVAGQQQPVSVYYDGRGIPTLVSGYRRLFAFLLLEERGLLDHVPVVHGRSGVGLVECVAVEQPKDEEGWARIAAANVAENARKKLSPIDIAWSLRRWAHGLDVKGGEFGLGKKVAGERMAAALGRFDDEGRPQMSERTVDRYLSLLALPLAIQGQVHRGEMKIDAALKVASEKGHGKAKGPRRGIKHSALRKGRPGVLARVVSRRKPNEARLFTPEEVEAALLGVAGVGDPPEWLAKWLEASLESEEAEAAE